MASGLRITLVFITVTVIISQYCTWYYIGLHRRLQARIVYIWSNRGPRVSLAPTPLGNPLSPSAKQPLELYQMELGPDLPTSQEAPFIPYF